MMRSDWHTNHEATCGLRLVPRELPARRFRPQKANAFQLSQQMGGMAIPVQPSDSRTEILLFRRASAFPSSQVAGSRVISRKPKRNCDSAGPKRRTSAAGLTTTYALLFST